MELQRKLGIRSYKTAWCLHHKIRTDMASSGKFLLAKEVEVEETYIGDRRPGKIGRGAEEKSLVGVVVETDYRSIGRANLTNIDDASVNSLETFVKNRVAPGAKVRTDAFPSYTLLNESYSHFPVLRKSMSNNDDPLPKVIHCNYQSENVVAWHIYFLLSKHFQKNLDEFMFRYNRRWNTGSIFDKLLVRSLNTSICTYAELTA